MSELTDRQLEILKIAHTTQRQEWIHRREERYKIFSWSSSLLLAVIGVLAAYADQFGDCRVRYIITGALLVLGGYILYWIHRRNQLAARTLVVLTRIDQRLGFFEAKKEEQSVYPREWLRFAERPSWRFRVGLIAENIVIFVLLLLALAMVWRGNN